MNVRFVSIVLCLPLLRCGQSGIAAEIDFNRDIRPILSQHCFACHGADDARREAGLRLDTFETATSLLESGERAIVPGIPGRSELLARITTDDEAERMPPEGERLSASQIATLREWISGGSRFAEHWSFVAPQRPGVPPMTGNWPRNAIDHFILDRLRAESLTPANEASRHTLIRRMSLDLRGLPPTPEEVDRFVHDESNDAYENLVDRFLRDAAYGERWARVWLDLARYADSRGFGSDPLRKNMWRYRDWVIEAFNSNMPYDQFTIEQLAGDLLEEPTLSQRMATAFHRNTMTNTEGGTDDEEFRVAAVKDRVDTTIQVWMGLTMGCAQCHNHKYDPISQKDYYEFYAIFNQTADNDRPNEAPTIEAPRPEDIAERKRVDEQIAEVRQQIKNLGLELEEEQKLPAEESAAGRFVRIDLPGKRKSLALAEVQIFSNGKNVARTGRARQSSTGYGGKAQFAIDGNTNGEFEEGSVTHTATSTNPWWEVDLKESATIEKVVVWNRTDGRLQSRLNGFSISILNDKRIPVWKETIKKAPQSHANLKTVQAGPIAQKIAAFEDEIASLEKQKPAFPTLPVMEELPPEKHRPTHIQVRGNFLSKGETVEPALLSSFNDYEVDNPPTRLDAAQWLLQPDNPLTARVAVNRIWSALFGIGIVETEEDFGTQGEPPSHPQLLDWLAVEFRDPSDRAARPWDMKRLIKLIVMSATYRQSSEVTPQHLETDPRNRLLGRAPRYRLAAETVRDQALALAGLLSRRLYGPSVYPYQPTGMWRAAFNGERKWPNSAGDDKFRRGLYTFWRRTVPYPSMATFDAPSREICTVRRIRTNTPLQALVTLNDPAYVEAAQGLGRRLLNEGGADAGAKASFGLSLCLARPAEPEQIAELVRLYVSELQHFEKHPDEAKELATDPLGPLPDGTSAAEAAAWTVVANVLLNMDAVLTRN